MNSKGISDNKKPYIYLAYDKSDIKPLKKTPKSAGTRSPSDFDLDPDGYKNHPWSGWAGLSEAQRRNLALTYEFLTPYIDYQ